MQNASEFLAAVQTYDETLNSLDDAIAFAIENSEQIGDMRWIGQFGTGTFYADQNSSHWFEDLTPYEVKLILAEKFMEDLQG